MQTPDRLRVRGGGGLQSEAREEEASFERGAEEGGGEYRQELRLRRSPRALFLPPRPLSLPLPKSFQTSAGTCHR